MTHFIAQPMTAAVQAQTTDMIMEGGCHGRNLDQGGGAGGGAEGKPAKFCAGGGVGGVGTV